jgi:hypothetical protein
MEATLQKILGEGHKIGAGKAGIGMVESANSPGSFQIKDHLRAGPGKQ